MCPLHSRSSMSWYGLIHSSLHDSSLVAQMVKHLPTMWKTQVRSLGWEDPLEKEMATHSSILSWRIPWTEEPGKLQSMESQRVRHDWVTSLSFFLSFFTGFWPSSTRVTQDNDSCSLGLSVWPVKWCWHGGLNCRV